MSDAIRTLADDLASLLDAPARPRKARNAPLWRLQDGLLPTPSSPVSSSARRVHVLKQSLSRSPEVLVKITGVNKEHGPLKAHLDYLRRKEGAEIEDERGNQLEANAETVKHTMRVWGMAVEEGRSNAADRREALRGGHEPPAHDSRKTIAVHIVLSMPAGTNAALVMDAARGFAREELANHQHLLVLHRDRDHPHVHVVVNNVGNDLRRLPRYKADLQRWRETFAEQLRHRGIDAAATPRRARGVLDKGESLSYLKAKERVARERADSLASGKRTTAPTELRGLRKAAERALNEAQGLRPVTPTLAHRDQEQLKQKLTRFDFEMTAALRSSIESLVRSMASKKSRAEALRDRAAASKAPKTEQPTNDLSTPQRKGPER